MPSRVALLAVVLALLAPLLVPVPASAAAGWQWPLRGDVLTPYRNGSDPYAGGQHRGIDIAGDPGAAVVAAVGGTVRFAGVAGDSGLTVSVRTADGRYDTSYLHLSSASVREGQRVDGGERIGAVGTSGRRSVAAPHLHFGVREAGDRHAYHDPMEFLPPPPARPREAPRGAPAPVAVPRRVAAAPERVPLRHGARVRARAPSARRVPVRHRLPLDRPAHVPALTGARRATSPVRPLVPAGGLAPHRAGEGARRAPGRLPQSGPDVARAPAAAPAPSSGPAASREGAGSRGPDLGWALACLGLLAAAACLGRPGGAKEGGRGDRANGGSAVAGLRALVRPLLGGR
jgi:murein DD-endopeptidase MepM/ murein hydrolase activator NlpD